MSNISRILKNLFPIYSKFKKNQYFIKLLNFGYKLYFLQSSKIKNLLTYYVRFYIII